MFTEKFDPTQGALLDKEETSPSHMEVREGQQLRWMLGSDGTLHSIMSIDDPSYPLMPHVTGMLTAFFINPDARNILILGLGSGSIERYCGARRPLVALTSVEISKERHTQVERYFSLPKHANVIIDDALNYLNKRPAIQDIIFCDIFDTEENKNQIYTKAFLELLSKNLSSDGVVSINYIYANQEDLLGFLINLRKVFTSTAILDIKNHANVVILATNQQTSITDVRAAAQETQKHQPDIDWLCITEQIEWLPQPEYRQPS